MKHGINFYANATVGGTATPVGATSSNILPLKLGAPAAGGAASNYFSGKMGPVMIYSEVLCQFALASPSIKL
jgi:hypothetical protein